LNKELISNTYTESHTKVVSLEFTKLKGKDSYQMKPS